jgi:hypothetical protein
MKHLHDVWRNYENDIEKYCLSNKLNFEKLMEMSQSSNKETLALQYSKIMTEDEISKLTMGGPPMPVVLWVRKNGGKLEFVQTEHTKKYLT